MLSFLGDLRATVWGKRRENQKRVLLPAASTVSGRGRGREAEQVVRLDLALPPRRPRRELSHEQRAWRHGQ